MHRIIFLLFVFVFQINLVLAQNSQELFNEGKELRASNKNQKAIKKYEEALEAAKTEKNIQLQMNLHIELAELKDNVVNYKEALNHYKEFTTLYKKQAAQKAKILEESVTDLQTKVEINNTEIEQKNTELEQKNTEIEQKNSDIKQKESAIDSLTTKQLQAQLNIKDLELANNLKALELQESNNRRNKLLFILGIVLLLALFIGRGYFMKRRGVRVLRQKNYEIIKAKQKSDELLLNILPETIAEELKEFGRTTPRYYENATVMFTDFKGFTKFSEKYSPEELVKLVDFYFSAFDKIITKYQIEKIKTIGDAYMCVSGIPEANNKDTFNIISAAIECMDFVRQTAEEKENQNLPYLEMRIGLHSGSLVAGVVGTHKFAYDIWGDTVNIAARMEQSGEPGFINVSESVYQLAKNEFSFTFRGEIEAKNKGKLNMYFVNSK